MTPQTIRSMALSLYLASSIITAVLTIFYQPVPGERITNRHQQSGAVSTYLKQREFASRRFPRVPGCLVMPTGR